MAFDLASISTGSVSRPPRIILLGVEKIGKSTFAAGANNSFILPIKGEEGIDDLGDCGKAPVCNSLVDVYGWFDFLLKEDHPFGTVCLDSTSTLAPMIEEESCQVLGLDKNGEGTTDNILKAGGGWGAGPKQGRVTWRNLTIWLDALRKERNMASILVGHVIVRRFDDPAGGSYDQYVWDIGEKEAALLYKWADSILFCNRRSAVVKVEKVGFGKEVKHGVDITGDQHFLYTQKRPAHPGGGRGPYGRLPYELPLSWPAFIDAVQKAPSQNS